MTREFQLRKAGESHEPKFHLRSYARQSVDGLASSANHHPRAKLVTRKSFVALGGRIAMGLNDRRACVLAHPFCCDQFMELVTQVFEPDDQVKIAGHGNQKQHVEQRLCRKRLGGAL